MKPLGYVVGAIAIVGSLSLVALTLRPGPATSSQPKIVKAELAPKPAAPIVEDLTLRAIGTPRPPAPAALSRPQAPALASALAPEEPGMPAVETMGRSLETDRAESLARMPKLKRGKGALKARKALRAKSAKKKSTAP